MPPHPLNGLLLILGLAASRGILNRFSGESLATDEFHDDLRIECRAGDASQARRDTDAGRSHGWIGQQGALQRGGAAGAGHSGDPEGLSHKSVALFGHSGPPGELTDERNAMMILRDGGLQGA
jgi:hypothetical protein